MLLHILACTNLTYRQETISTTAPTITGAITGNKYEMQYKLQRDHGA
jgi:hypothetical protein